MQPTSFSLFLSSEAQPVLNVGTTDVLLYPQIHLGSLCGTQVISLARGVTEVKLATASVSAQGAASVAQNGLASIDLATLPEEEQREVRSLLQQYISVFPNHDGDLGCSNLISHNIPLLDNVPVRQQTGGRLRVAVPGHHQLFWSGKRTGVSDCV